MKNLQSFLVEEQEIFGPGTDLVISLVAVLIISMAISTDSFRQQLKQSVVDCQELKSELQTCQAQLADYKKRLADCNEKYHQCEIAKQKLEKIMEESGIGQLDIKEVEKSQTEIVNRIAQKYNGKPSLIDKETYGISTNKNGEYDIVIQNDVTLQRIRFGTHILFDSDEVELKDRGKEVLTTVGNIFKEKLDSIKEIQIQGHADPKKSQKFSSNLELASNRAIKVFMHLQEELGIDPTRHIMSATSFGEYKPVQRSDTEEYDDSKLKKHNETPRQRERNRRIEIVLIYRRN